MAKPEKPAPQGSSSSDDKVKAGDTQTPNDTASGQYGGSESDKDEKLWREQFML